MTDLVLVCAVIFLMSTVIYMVLDGLSLGVGILLPLLNHHERHIALETMHITWDGNETWIVMAIAVLYGAFPSAYGHLSHTYGAIYLMVIGFIFRGVGIEFHYRDNLWTYILSFGSCIAIIGQGLLVSCFMGLDGASTLLCISSLICCYFLLGTCWVFWRTTPPLKDKLILYCGPVSSILYLYMAVLLSLHIGFWGGVLGLCLSAVHYAGIKGAQSWDGWPFIYTAMTMICGLFLMHRHSWPYIMGSPLNFYLSASQDISLAFIAVISFVFFPFILVNIYYIYQLFYQKINSSV